MKLNPLKSFYFRKSAVFTLETLEDTQALASAFAGAFSAAQGLKRFGLCGKPKSGKTAFANSWVKAALPMETKFEKEILEKPFRLLAYPEAETFLRHYDAAMLRCAPEEDKKDLTSFSGYFRDVNPYGLDLVEHPEQESPEIRSGGNGHFHYILKFERASNKNETRRVSVFPAPAEVKSEAFQSLIPLSDDGYRCFKTLGGIPYLP